MTHFNLGWYKKFDDKSKAEKLVKETRLIKVSELKKLFPDGKIYKERYFGLTKSFVIANNTELKLKRSIC